MKKMLFALVMVAMMAGSALATDVICGGQVPLINNVIGIGMMSLDFGSSSPAGGVECAQLFINNNSTTWDLAITTKNGTTFNSSHVGGTTIPATTMIVSAGALTAGSSVSVATPIAFAALANKDLAVGDIALSVTQATATVMYNLTIKAEWTYANTYLAGIYTETVIATIVATL